MLKEIELDIHGLKCDNKDCDYRDDTIPLSSYKAYVGAPCPQCGQSLLTKKDYYFILGLVNLAKAVNKVMPERQDTDRTFNLSFKMNGTGKIDLEEIKKVDRKL